MNTLAFFSNLNLEFVNFDFARFWEWNGYVVLLMKGDRWSYYRFIQQLQMQNITQCRFKRLVIDDSMKKFVMKLSLVLSWWGNAM